jgi:histidinol-phosphatase (PHP family)
MIYKTDYHIHSTFSDGKEIPDEYITRAIDTGIREIGFSEHINLVSENQNWCMNPDSVNEYISYLKRLTRRTRSVKIKMGLEVDYARGMENKIYRYLKDLDLDYVIGSVHYLGEKSVDSGPDYFENKDIDEIFTSYFSLVNEAVESGLFDIIGHCDLVRIFRFIPSSDTEHFYRKLAGKMKIHDVAFELNTNGRNRPLADFYPDRRFLKIFRENNVPVCVNSDAHFPMRVGQYFNEAYYLLKEAGYNEMAVFNKRERFLVPADFNLL